MVKISLLGIVILKSLHFVDLTFNLEIILIGQKISNENM